MGAGERGQLGRDARFRLPDGGAGWAGWPLLRCLLPHVRTWQPLFRRQILNQQIWPIPRNQTDLVFLETTSCMPLHLPPSLPAKEARGAAMVGDGREILTGRREEGGEWAKSCEKMVPLDTDLDAGGPVWHLLSLPDYVLQRGRRGDKGRRERRLQERRKCLKEDC